MKDQQFINILLNIQYLSKTIQLKEPLQEWKRRKIEDITKFYISKLKGNEDVQD